MNTRGLLIFVAVFTFFSSLLLVPTADQRVSAQLLINTPLPTSITAPATVSADTPTTAPTTGATMPPEGGGAATPHGINDNPASGVNVAATANKGCAITATQKYNTKVTYPGTYTANGVKITSSYKKPCTNTAAGYKTTGSCTSAGYCKAEKCTNQSGVTVECSKVPGGPTGSGGTGSGGTGGSTGTGGTSGSGGYTPPFIPPSQPYGSTINDLLQGGGQSYSGNGMPFSPPSQSYSFPDTFSNGSGSSVPFSPPAGSYSLPSSFSSGNSILTNVAYDLNPGGNGIPFTAPTQSFNNLPPAIQGTGPGYTDNGIPITQPPQSYYLPKDASTFTPSPTDTGGTSQQQLPKFAEIWTGINDFGKATADITTNIAKATIVGVEATAGRFATSVRGFVSNLPSDPLSYLSKVPIGEQPPPSGNQNAITPITGYSFIGSSFGMDANGQPLSRATLGNIDSAPLSGASSNNIPFDLNKTSIAVLTPLDQGTSHGTPMGSITNPPMSGSTPTTPTTEDGIRIAEGQAQGLDEVGAEIKRQNDLLNAEKPQVDMIKGLVKNADSTLSEKSYDVEAEKDSSDAALKKYNDFVTSHGTKVTKPDGSVAYQLSPVDNKTAKTYKTEAEKARADYESTFDDYKSYHDDTYKPLAETEKAFVDEYNAHLNQLHGLQDALKADPQGVALAKIGSGIEANRAWATEQVAQIQENIDNGNYYPIGGREIAEGKIEKILKQQDVLNQTFGKAANFALSGAPGSDKFVEGMNVSPTDPKQALAQGNLITQAAKQQDLNTQTAAQTLDGSPTPLAASLLAQCRGDGACESGVQSSFDSLAQAKAKNLDMINQLSRIAVDPANLSSVSPEARQLMADQSTPWKDAAVGCMTGNGCTTFAHVSLDNFVNDANSAASYLRENSVYGLGTIESIVPSFAAGVVDSGSRAIFDVPATTQGRLDYLTSSDQQNSALRGDAILETTVNGLGFVAPVMAAGRGLGSFAKDLYTELGLPAERLAGGGLGAGGDITGAFTKYLPVNDIKGLGGTMSPDLFGLTPESLTKKTLEPQGVVYGPLLDLGLSGSPGRSFVMVPEGSTLIPLEGGSGRLFTTAEIEAARVLPRDITGAFADYLPQSAQREAQQARYQQIQESYQSRLALNPTVAPASTGGGIGYFVNSLPVSVRNFIQSSALAGQLLTGAPVAIGDTLGMARSFAADVFRPTVAENILNTTRTPVFTITAPEIHTTRTPVFTITAPEIQPAFRATTEYLRSGLASPVAQDILAATFPRGIEGTFLPSIVASQIGYLATGLASDQAVPTDLTVNNPQDIGIESVPNAQLPTTAVSQPAPPIAEVSSAEISPRVYLATKAPDGFYTNYVSHSFIVLDRGANPVPLDISGIAPTQRIITLSGAPKSSYFTSIPPSSNNPLIKRVNAPTNLAAWLDGSAKRAEVIPPAGMSPEEFLQKVIQAFNNLPDEMAPYGMLAGNNLANSNEMTTQILNNAGIPPTEIILYKPQLVRGIAPGFGYGLPRSLADRVVAPIAELVPAQPSLLKQVGNAINKIIGVTPANARTTRISQCGAECLVPTQGTITYYDPRLGGINAFGNGRFTANGQPTNIRADSFASTQYPFNTVAQICAGQVCRYGYVSDTGGFQDIPGIGGTARIADLLPGLAGNLGMKGMAVGTIRPIANYANFSSRDFAQGAAAAQFIADALNNGSAILEAEASAAQQGLLQGITITRAPSNAPTIEANQSPSSPFTLASYHPGPTIERAVPTPTALEVPVAPAVDTSAPLRTFIANQIKAAPLSQTKGYQAVINQIVPQAPAAFPIALPPQTNPEMTKPLSQMTLAERAAVVQYAHGEVSKFWKNAFARYGLVYVPPSLNVISSGSGDTQLNHGQGGLDFANHPDILNVNISDGALGTSASDPRDASNLEYLIAHETGHGVMRQLGILQPYAQNALANEKAADFLAGVALDGAGLLRQGDPQKVFYTVATHGDDYIKVTRGTPNPLSYESGVHAGTSAQRAQNVYNGMLTMGNPDQAFAQLGQKSSWDNTVATRGVQPLTVPRPGVPAPTALEVAPAPAAPAGPSPAQIAQTNALKNSLAQLESASKTVENLGAQAQSYADASRYGMAILTSGKMLRSAEKVTQAASGIANQTNDSALKADADALTQRLETTARRTDGVSPDAGMLGVTSFSDFPDLIKNQLLPAGQNIQKRAQDDAQKQIAALQAPTAPTTAPVTPGAPVAQPKVAQTVTPTNAPTIAPDHPGRVPNVTVIKPVHFDSQGKVTNPEVIPADATNVIGDPQTGMWYSCAQDLAACQTAFGWEMRMERDIELGRKPANTTFASYQAGNGQAVAQASIAPQTTPQPTLQQFDDFLWGRYQRTPWSGKDEAAAARRGMTLEQYVIGGMDPNLKINAYSMIKAAEAKGIHIGITSGFRDDYRQSLITSGTHAQVGNSWHGGSLVTAGFGHGMAFDIEGIDGTPSIVAQHWVDQNGQQFGVGRPYGDSWTDPITGNHHGDGPHVAPTNSPEYTKRKGDPSVPYQIALAQEKAQLGSAVANVPAPQVATVASVPVSSTLVKSFSIGDNGAGVEIVGAEDIIPAEDTDPTALVEPSFVLQSTQVRTQAAQQSAQPSAISSLLGDLANNLTSFVPALLGINPAQAHPAGPVTVSPSTPNTNTPSSPTAPVIPTSGSGPPSTEGQTTEGGPGNGGSGSINPPGTSESESSGTVSKGLTLAGLSPFIFIASLTPSAANAPTAVPVSSTNAGSHKNRSGRNVNIFTAPLDPANPPTPPANPSPKTDPFPRDPRINPHAHTTIPNWLNRLASFLSGLLGGYGGNSPSRPGYPSGGYPGGTQPYPNYPNQPGQGVPPTLRLSASPQTVMVSSSTRLIWSSTNTNTCYLFGPSAKYIAQGSPNGSYQISHLATTTTYSMTCTSYSYGRNIYATTTVMVIATSTATSTSNR